MSAVATTTNAPPSLMSKFAARFGVEPSKMMSTLKATAFRVKDGPEVSNEQMMALLIVADQYGLNPWTKEIYAYPDKGGIVPVVGVDGWVRMVNEHAAFDGIEFHDADGDGLPAYIECVIHRKDRSHATIVREYMAECKKGTIPWNTHPRRMLRHKALIQCARIAFGFAGIYDDDEAQRIIDGSSQRLAPEPSGTVAAINAQVRATAKQAPQTIDVESSEPAQSSDNGEALSPTAAARKAIASAATVEALDLARSLIKEAPEEDRGALLDDAVERFNAPQPAA